MWYRFDTGDNKFSVYTDITKIAEEPDVIIDFSVPVSTFNVLQYAVEKHIPIVICTTGFLKEELEKIYECSHIPIFFTNHHIAHAYSSFFSSGLDNALVFVADGAGDYINGMQEAESLFVAKNNKVEMLCRRLQNPTTGHMTDERNYLLPYMPSFIQD